MKITKYLKANLKNGKRTLATASVDDKGDIIEAMKGKQWEQVLIPTIEKENKSDLAFVICGYTLLQTWPWISLKGVDDENVFGVEFDQSKLSSFRELVQKGKIKNEIGATFSDIESVIEEIAEDESLKSKALKTIKNITVESVVL